MAKKVRFPLKMANGVEIRTLEKLREHFDFFSVLSYYDSGKLIEWLNDRYCENEAERIKALNPSASDFKKSLCDILGASYSENDDVKEIYLCGERFTIPGSKSGVAYIGVNNPVVDVPEHFYEKGIVFRNIDLGIYDIVLRAKKEADHTKAVEL